MTLTGLSDVGINGKYVWNNTDTTILLSKGRVISISLDDNQTAHHFLDQPILGLVESAQIT